jgi:hypothetical protein
MPPLGIIAEDRTDCETVKVLIRRMLQAANRRPPSIKDFAPNSGGCAAMRRKAPKWARELRRAGCGAVVLIHDLDRNPHNGELNHREQLTSELRSLVGHDDYVCIPVEELEAWFWSDQAVLDAVTKGRARALPHPERLARPKEVLRDHAYRGRGRALATTENAELAALLDLQRCAASCPSFASLQAFILTTCV